VLVVLCWWAAVRVGGPGQVEERGINTALSIKKREREGARRGGG